ncbi:hypothetical protein ACFFWC_27240 [Plantactinospora siamensis]|uniref:Uncharacterized protein n=1 Tax=Plantactinospora siamensis TaxID=555372 RepID=A0ABV6NYS8_9ACTN
MTTCATPITVGRYARRSRDGRPPAPWTVRLAHLIPLLALPSGLWRVALVAGVPLGLLAGGVPARTHGAESAQIIGLSMFSEALALLSLGLVRRWGEVVPGWVPLLGGRRIPPYAVVTAAGVGSVLLMLTWAYATMNFFGPNVDLGFAGPWGEALLVACYLPLHLWGPALLALTWAYHRRRCRD